MNQNQMIWVVTTPSAYRIGHQCFLGCGPTKAAAIEDAYGPKDSWSNGIKRLVRNADIIQVTEDECREMQYNS
jgi:hypothetical protein